MGLEQILNAHLAAASGANGEGPQSQYIAIGDPNSLWSGVGAFELVMLIAGAALTIGLAGFFLYLWSRGDRESPGESGDPDHG